jgi:hypothetical protein
MTVKQMYFMETAGLETPLGLIISIRMLKITGKVYTNMKHSKEQHKFMVIGMI